MKILSSDITDYSAQVVTLELKQGVTDYIVWISDIHGDSKSSSFSFLDSVLRKHPEALIIVGGDHLDVMQNVNDPRASKSALMEELKDDDYLGRVIELNLNRWDKYAKRIISFFIGNHELTQIRRHGIDVSRQIIERLNDRHGTNITLGDLQGWMKLRFLVNGRHFSKNIFYQHHPESGGKRSKGMLSVDIAKGKYPDADIWIAEHIHDTWIKPEVIENFTDKGIVKVKNKWFLQMPTLKDEHSHKPRRGYVHRKNFGRVPIGVMVFEIETSRKGVSITPKYKLVSQ